jgi:uncharacterized membrane protein
VFCLGDHNVLYSLVHFIVACMRFLILSQQSAAPSQMICHVHGLFGLPHMFVSCGGAPLPASSMPTPSRLATFPPPLCHTSGGIDVGLLVNGISSYIMPRFPSLTVTLQHLVQKHWRDDVTFAFLDTSLPPLLPWATLRGGNYTPSASPPPLQQLPSSTPIGQRPLSASPSPQLPSYGRIVGAPPQYMMTTTRDKDALMAAQVASQTMHQQTQAAASLIKRPQQQQQSLPSSSDEAMTLSLRKALQCPFSSEGDIHMLADPVMSPCCGESFCRQCVPIYLEFVAGTSISKSGSKAQVEAKAAATANNNILSPNGTKPNVAFTTSSSSSTTSGSSSTTSAPSTPLIGTSSLSSDRERPIKEKVSVTTTTSNDATATATSAPSTPAAATERKSPSVSGKSTPSSTPKKSAAPSPTGTVASSTPVSSASSSSSLSSSSSNMVVATPPQSLTTLSSVSTTPVIIVDDQKPKVSAKPIGTCGCGHMLADEERRQLPLAPRNQALASVIHALVLAKKLGAL